MLYIINFIGYFSTLFSKLICYQNITIDIVKETSITINLLGDYNNLT